MQAKYVACYGVATQAVWLKNFVYGLLVVDSISKSLPIYCDNNAGVFFSKNNKSNSGSKHLEIKYLTVRDLVKKGDIEIKHIDTKLMLVDPLTKGFRPIVFKGHVTNMGVVESFNVFV